VNTEVPASQNAAFAFLKLQKEELDSQAGQGPSLLSFLDVGSLHKELHSQEFVLELAKRSHEGFKVGAAALTIGTPI
jgi:hypothetical protein